MTLSGEASLVILDATTLAAVTTMNPGGRNPSGVETAPFSRG